METLPSNHGNVVPTSSEGTDDTLDKARQAVATCPLDHPERLGSFIQLGNLLWDRFEDTNKCDYTLLDECVDVWRRVCDLCPIGYPHRARLYGNLAAYLRIHFEQLGDQSLLEEAISFSREALSLTPTGHPDRADSCRNLAASLHRHFEELGDQSLLDEAISLEREALSLTPTGHPDRMHSCRNLAISLHKRFDQLGDQLLLNEAISLLREALSLTPTGHPNRARLCRNLAASLHNCFDQFGDESLLDEAISLQREGLYLTPTGHPDRAHSCRVLAVSLHTYFQQFGDQSLLDEAISLKSEALSLTPTGHPDRAHSCRTLAASLHKRFEQLGDQTLLDEVISLLREAQSLTPSGHSDRAHSCKSLAASIHTRFQQLGDQSLLDEAISLQKEALRLTPTGNPDRADSCTSLAASFYTCFQQLGDQTLLDKAISLLREALSLTPTGHPDRADSCKGLASSLHTRFEQFGDQSLLDEAISLEREALSLTPTGHPDRAHSCLVLAASLRRRFEQFGDQSSLSESKALYKESIQSQPPNHPLQWRALAALSSMHFDKQMPTYNMNLAIDYLCQAVSLDAASLPYLLSAVGDTFSRINSSDVPTHTRPKYLQCLSITLDLSSLVIGFILDHRSQLKYLASCRAIGSSAYFIAALCNQKELGLELLEHARGMIWSQLLHVRDPQFEGVPLDMASELQQLLCSISTSNPVDKHAPRTTGERASYLTPPDVRYQQNTRINQLIQEIRALPGHDYFMRRLPFNDLARCAANHAVVVLIAGQQQCRALILKSMSDALEEVFLENVTSEELGDLSVAIQARGMRGANSTEADRRGMQISFRRTPLLRVLYKLWTSVVKPVLDCLGLKKAKGLSRPRLHWCPTGTFTFLPLHAAGIYEKGTEECCSGYVVSSYTPTLAALLRAQKSWPVINVEASRLALVAAPKAHDSTLPVLNNVREEMYHVVSVAKQAHLSINESCFQQAATLAYTADSLTSSTFAHIACHGIQHPADPLSSGFCLHDDNLTVSRLMELDLKDSFLAFLSACETAKGDTEQPDQTVHLAATMLFVGFRSVVATMWATGDEDGPQVAKFFYEKLFSKRQISLDDIPYALDYALGKLKESGVPPERWVTFIQMGA